MRCGNLLGSSAEITDHRTAAKVSSWNKSQAEGNFNLKRLHIHWICFPENWNWDHKLLKGKQDMVQRIYFLILRLPILSFTPWLHKAGTNSNTEPSAFRVIDDAPPPLPRPSVFPVMDSFGHFYDRDGHSDKNITDRRNFKMGRADDDRKGICCNTLRVEQILSGNWNGRRRTKLSALCRQCTTTHALCT